MKTNTRSLKSLCYNCQKLTPSLCKNTFLKE